MRTIGLLGGMSWESSIEYETIINREVRARLGGMHSADLLIRSYDFAEIERLQSEDDWSSAGQLLGRDARRLEAAGAELIALCTNTMHRVAGDIEESIGVPFVHIGDATGAAIRASGVDPIALLGTRYTMEHDFLRKRLEDHGVSVIVPDEADRTCVHDVIYRELVQGVIRPESKQTYLEVIERQLTRGAGDVAQNNTRQRSAIDARTTRHAGHEVSMRIRKRIEEPFGWMKTVGGSRKLRYIGRERNRAWFKINAAVYNLIRITALDAAT